MVILVAILALALPPGEVKQGLAGEAATERTPVREAMGREKYPWYDAKADKVKPLWPPDEWNLDWLDRGLRRLSPSRLPESLGDVFALMLVLLGLAILLGVLAMLWRQYRPAPEDRRDAQRRAAAAARIEGLPQGLRPATDDPWAEALECRARGDYARAVVCLFVHQLLTLDRLREVRLVPGRTGRQLVRAIADREFRGWVDPTLRLFEAVYYGQRVPSAEVFEPVWAAAEAFERRVAGGLAR